MCVDIGNYDAVTFDCYGTLIDWDTGVSSFFSPWIARHGVDCRCAELIGEFAKAQRAHQGHKPFKIYRTVLREAFRDAARAVGAEPEPAELDQFAASVGTWPVFPDTGDALRDLRHAGLHLGVVSNVDDASFAETRARLGQPFDTVVTAEMAQAYKPDLKMFEALFAALSTAGIDRRRVLHVAQSRFHDVAPGRKLGLDVVWIDRRRGRPGRGITIESDAQPEWRFASLAEFSAAVANTKT